ncbi:hypothetical protein VTI74DRAFT_6982 [Chaetomium olivicolor]
MTAVERYDAPTISPSLTTHLWFRPLLLGIIAYTTASSCQQQSHNLIPVPHSNTTCDINGIPIMATLLENANGFHPGERAIHALLKVPSRQNPTAAGLPPSYAHRVTVSPLVAIGTVDDNGQPWTSIWGGERGFARPVAQNILGMQSLVDKAHDPVVQALLGKVAEGEVLRPDEDRVMSALSIDLESRDRVKFAGKMVIGTVAGRPGMEAIGEAQLGMLVQESLGNCPKYLNKKTIRAHLPSPQLVSSSLPLPPEAIALIEQADMFFVSSTNGQTMDTNHRGGPAGFLRVVSNSPGGMVLVYPEYSGNRLYQTLGNLYTNPLIGIAIPDFNTSDVLYLTGEAHLLVGAAATDLLPHTTLAVKITIHSARFVRDGLPFRGAPGEPSPYNPPVRKLVSECRTSIPPTTASPIAKATLLRREHLTPSIARFTFLLQPTSTSTSSKGLKRWRAGQHLTLSLARHLSLGYAHMNDADPQSLNDDFVRTFTVSSPPPPPPSSSVSQGEEEADAAVPEQGVEVQLTLRKHGPGTGFLFGYPMRATVARLEVDVLGVGGGEEGFRIPIPEPPGFGEGEGEGGEGTGKKAVFVAGGIGITPLLAQAPVVLTAGDGRGLEVLWSLRVEDLALVVDAVEGIRGLAGVTRVFVTGVSESEVTEEQKEVIEKVRGLGVRVELRRIGEGDVLGVRDAVRGTKYFICASHGMQRAVLGWLEEEEVVYESFEY